MSLTKVSFILADIFRYLYRRFFCVLCINAWNSTQKNADNQLDQLKRSNNTNEDLSSVSGTVGNGEQSRITSLSKDKPHVEIKDDDDYTVDEDNANVKIPLVVVVGGLLAYIVFGAYIFKALQDLTWVNGIYYSYVSLSTIGNLSFVS